MKKIFTLGVIFVFLFSLTESLSSADKFKTKKARIITPDVTLDAAIALPGVKALPLRSTIINSAKVTLGVTDYDYGWNSGSKQNVVFIGGKVYAVFNERDVINNAAAPANRRAVKFVYLDGATKVEGYPIPKATMGTGWGSVTAPASGAAAGFGMVVGHIPVWFGIENAAGTGNFSTGNIANAKGSLDPQITFDNGRQRIVATTTSPADGRADYAVGTSDDFGGTWTYGDSALCEGASGTGKGHVAGTLDAPILVAPNGTYALPTTLTGTGTIAPIGTANPDSADNIGYFKSINGGTSWTWTTIGRDGDMYVVGTDTLYAYYENFGQMSAVYDKDSKLNIVVNGYTIKLVNDSTSANYFCTMYWKEGMTKFKIISNVANIRVEDYDTYSYSGNGLGFAYPAIAADPASAVLYASWSQPSVTGGKVDTVKGGFPLMQLWYTASADGGTTWKTAVKIAGTDGALFNTAAPTLTTSGTDHVAHLTYLADTSAGCNVFGEGVKALVPVVYLSFTFNKTTSVGDDNVVANSFTLGQNYPNPFNPTTKIDYSISKSSKVTLSVYNVMGQEVAQLVNGVQESGKHSINFNASKLASGVYIYKLSAGNFQETKKMVLMK